MARWSIWSGEGFEKGSQDFVPELGACPSIARRAGGWSAKVS
jgi:hypothetical protein